MNKRFTIGEMSKLHHIPVKTLRYYDEIDLFKPFEVDERTGYRYYSTEQFEHLNTIHYLRELGIPLKEIKSVFEKRDVDFFYHLLKKQGERVTKQIEELKKVKRRTQNRMNELVWAKTYTHIDKPHIQEVPERSILELKEQIHTKEELELALRKLENISSRRASVFIGGVGVTSDIADIRKGHLNKYQSIFLITEEPVDSPYSRLLPEQLYVCLYCREARIHSKEYYDSIFAYLENEGYHTDGPSIERAIIDDFVTKNKEEFLCEIQIPVRPVTT